MISNKWRRTKEEGQGDVEITQTHYTTQGFIKDVYVTILFIHLDDTFHRRWPGQNLNIDIDMSWKNIKTSHTLTCATFPEQETAVAVILASEFVDVHKLGWCGEKDVDENRLLTPAILWVVTTFYRFQDGISYDNWAKISHIYTYEVMSDREERRKMKKEGRKGWR